LPEVKPRHDSPREKRIAELANALAYDLPSETPRLFRLTQEACSGIRRFIDKLSGFMVLTFITQSLSEYGTLSTFHRKPPSIFSERAAAKGRIGFA
jgi:hypothetical protein